MKFISGTIALLLGMTAVCSAQSQTQYFPQVVGGSGGGVTWQTAFVVSNPAAVGSSSATVTITMFQDDGSAFNIASQFINAVTGLPGGTGNTISFTITGGQSRFFLTEDPVGPITGGFAKVVSTAPVSATSVFSERVTATEKQIALAGVAGTAGSSRQAAFVVRNDGNDVGIGFANPNSATASVTFTLINTTGAIVGTPVTRTLATNRHTALFVSELFPTMPNNFFGTMQMITDASTPLVATTLFFTPDGTFATFPMIPLP